MKVHHIFVLGRQLQHRRQQVPVLLGDRLCLAVHHLVQGGRLPPEHPPQHVPAPVDGHPQHPGFFVLGAFKGLAVQGKFEKHLLQDILGVRRVFQVHHAHPPYHVPIGLHGPANFLLASHLSPTLLRLLLLSFQRIAGFLYRAIRQQVFRNRPPLPWPWPPFWQLSHAPSPSASTQFRPWPWPWPRPPFW